MKKSRQYFSYWILLLLVFPPTSGLYAATLTGTISYDGDAPKFNEIKMDADPICLTHHTTPVYPQTLVLGEGNTMGNVFIYVKNGLGGKNFPAPTETIVIDQKGCQYSPHVSAAMVGQPVKFLNPDGTLHNVHSISKVNPEFNVAMPKFRTETVKVFDKEEFMFPLKCDVHPWMSGWLAIMSHPFFSTTDSTGKFKIVNLPAGTYEIEAWHEKLGVQKTSVTLTGDEVKDITFTFSKPKK